MITQEAGTGDGRAQMLALNGAGRSIVQVLAVDLDETDRELFGDLDPRTRALIVSTMRAIIHRRSSGAVPVD